MEQFLEWFSYTTCTESHWSHLQSGVRESSNFEGIPTEECGSRYCSYSFHEDPTQKFNHAQFPRCSRYKSRKYKERENQYQLDQKYKWFQFHEGLLARARSITLIYGQPLLLKTSTQEGTPNRAPHRGPLWRMCLTLLSRNGISFHSIRPVRPQLLWCCLQTQPICKR